MVLRNLHAKCLQLLGVFPAIILVGPRQAGKTTLARSLKKGWRYFDLENPADLDRISFDINYFFSQHPHSIILDEAQDAPDIFKILRGVIDQKRDIKGRFIITGSSSPELIKQVSESLAGRVAIIEVGTLKTNESHEKPLSPLYQIFQDKLTPQLPIQGAGPLTHQQLHANWLRGGYPEPTLTMGEQQYRYWMENYRSTYINRDLAKLFPKLNKIAYRRFLSMLGNLSGTIINKSDIGRAIEVSESTIRDYMEIADGTFLWRTIPSFERSVSKSIIKMPKGYIRDTGLLHFLLNISSMEELQNHPIVGASFEGFVCEELIRGIEASDVVGCSYHYYRTRGGAEVDLIVQGPFGVLPIEIKHGSSVKRQQLRSLIEFVKQNGLPLGLLINQGDRIEQLTENIVQVPAGWL